MNARDELAKLLFITDNHSPDAEQDWLHLKPYGPKYLRGYYDEADAVFAAGYRKPRTITTTEELKTVFEGAILRDSHGHMWGIDGGTGRLFDVLDGADETYDDEELPLPATVIYEDEAAA